MYCGFFLNTASLQTSVTNAEIQNITIDYLFQSKLTSASQYEEKTPFFIFHKGNIRNSETWAESCICCMAVPEYWQAGRNWLHGDGNN